MFQCSLSRARLSVILGMNLQNLDFFMPIFNLAKFELCGRIASSTEVTEAHDDTVEE